MFSAVKKHLIVLWLVVLIALNLGYFFQFQDNRNDDAYITYRVARNLFKHQTFSYNLGESYLVTTSPLSAIIFAPFTAIGKENFPLIANYICNFFLIAMLISVWFFLLRKEPDFSLVIFLSVLVVIPMFYFLLGMETNLFIFLLFLAILLLINQNFVVSGLVSALACLARGDSLLLLGIAPLYIFFINSDPTSRVKRFIRYLSSFVLIYGSWSVYSKFQFGSFFPSTFKTKIIQAVAKVTPTTYLEFLFQGQKGKELLDQIIFLNDKRVVLILALLSFVGLCWYSAQIFQRSRSNREIPQAELFLYLVTLFGWLQALGYSLLRVAFYPWYLVPLFISINSGCLLLFRQVAIYFPKPVKLKYLMALLFFILIVFLRPAHFPVPPWTGSLGETYIEVSKYLNDYSKNDKKMRIALGEAGIIGYYLDEQPIYDYYGVVTPYVLAPPPLNWPDNFRDSLLKMKPPVLVTHSPFLPAWVKRYFLLKKYEPNYRNWRIYVYYINYQPR